MSERKKELRRRRQRRMKRIKKRLHAQMSNADNLRTERAAEKQKRRMKRAAGTEESGDDSTSE